MISERISYIAQTHPKEKARPFELKAKTLALLAVLFTLASLVGWFYLTQASEATITALRFERLVSEREHLRRENAELRNQLAQMEGISQLREKARLLGFAPPKETNFIYLSASTMDWQKENALPQSEGVGKTKEPNPWERFLSYLRLLLLGRS